MCRESPTTRGMQLCCMTLPDLAALPRSQGDFDGVAPPHRRPLTPATAHARVVPDNASSHIAATPTAAAAALPAHGRRRRRPHGASAPLRLRNIRVHRARQTGVGGGHPQRQRQDRCRALRTRGRVTRATLRRHAPASSPARAALVFVQQLGLNGTSPLVAKTPRRPDVLYVLSTST